MIEKNNRKLKGTDSNLGARRLMFERVRSLWSEQRGVWCAVDFEAWDMDHSVITEFGWSTLRWIGGEPVEDMGHLIVGKHRTYTNHFVPENRRVSRTVVPIIINPDLLMSALPVLLFWPV
jgi:hypothetical protein